MLYVAVGFKHTAVESSLINVVKAANSSYVLFFFIAMTGLEGSTDKEWLSKSESHTVPPEGLHIITKMITFWSSFMTHLY